METREKKGKKSKGRDMVLAFADREDRVYLHIEIIFGIMGLYARIGGEGTREGRGTRGDSFR